MFWKIALGLLIGGVAAAAAVGIAGLVYDWVQKRITGPTVQEHFAAKIKEKLDNGDYNTVNAGLVDAEVIDVSQKDGVTYVAYEVDGERYGIRSREGTDLSENERLTLSL